MANLETVFRGVYVFCFDFPESEKYGIIRFPGFAAVSTLDRLELMQGDSDSDFPYAQAIAVSKTEGYGFYDEDSGSVLAYSDAVHWVLCFPVVRQPNGKYISKTSKISVVGPSIPRDSRTLIGDRVFFCFSSAINDTPDEKPILATPYLSRLGFLSPQPGDKLTLVRASRWRAFFTRGTVSIKPKYLLDTETVSDSEVYVL